MENKQRTIGFVCDGSKPTLREGSNGKGRTIEGLAIVFNKDSVILCEGRHSYFRECIKPEAITQKDLLGYDIKMTAFHNREKLLARWHVGGTGTLKLWVDREGVHYSFVAPTTSLGEEILSSVKRGDMTGASFTFSANGTRQTVTTDPDGIERHTITKLGEVSEMTIAADPAYPNTTVEAREREALRARTEKEELMKRSSREKAIRENAIAQMDLDKTEITIQYLNLAKAVKENEPS